jgi:hypothetical protein
MEEMAGAIREVKGRALLMTHYEREGGMHSCVLVYSGMVPDDMGQIWQAAGATWKEASDLVWESFWKSREETNPDNTSDKESK